MGSEILVIPEEDLETTIKFIRIGILPTIKFLGSCQDDKYKDVLRIARRLSAWCDSLEDSNKKEDCDSVAHKKTQ